MALLIKAKDSRDFDELELYRVTVVGLGDGNGAGS